MELIIPPEVEKVIEKIGNKTKQESAYKIYYALIKNSKKSDKKGFFPIPSKLLKKVNSRYNLIIQSLVENKIIEFKKTPDFDPVTFDKIQRKTYNVFKGECIKYRFLVDINKGGIKNIEINNHRKYKWYDTIKNSLKELGFEDQKISRVAFGERVYYGLIQKYKRQLKNKGFSIIDARASQPKLLLYELRKNNYYDKNYEEAFKNDFYTYLELNLKLKSRDEAKEHFMFYLNGNGYTLNNNIYSLFPQASLFLKNLKKGNYKNSANFFQKIESNIWINDLLENLPVNFGLPVHDCLIVKNEDADLVLAYCQNKYPKIDFVLKKI